MSLFTKNKPVKGNHTAVRLKQYTVRGLEQSGLGGSHGCPIHSTPNLGQSIPT